jgi:hypothetical protein
MDPIAGMVTVAPAARIAAAALFKTASRGLGMGDCRGDGGPDGCLAWFCLALTLVALCVATLPVNCHARTDGHSPWDAAGCLSVRRRVYVSWAAATSPSVT